MRSEIAGLGFDLNEWDVFSDPIFESCELPHKVTTFYVSQRSEIGPWMASCSRNGSFEVYYQDKNGNQYGAKLTYEGADQAQKANPSMAKPAAEPPRKEKPKEELLGQTRDFSALESRMSCLYKECTDSR